MNHISRTFYYGTAAAAESGLCHFHNCCCHLAHQCCCHLLQLSSYRRKGQQSNPRPREASGNKQRSSSVGTVDVRHCIRGGAAAINSQGLSGFPRPLHPQLRLRLPPVHREQSSPRTEATTVVPATHRRWFVPLVTLSACTSHDANAHRVRWRHIYPLARSSNRPAIILVLSAASTAALTLNEV